MARSYQQHGLTPLHKALKSQGMAVIPRNTRLGKAMAAWRAELEAHLGGQVTSPMASLLDTAEVTKVMLASIDAFLLAGAKDRSHIFNRKRRALTALALQRLQLVESHRRDMLALGLDRQHRAIDSEHAIVAAVRQDLRRARRKKPKAASNGMSTGPAAGTSTVEAVQYSATPPIAQSGQEAPTTAGN